MKRVVVLGSTGSIGTQTLDIAARNPDTIRIVGLAAGRNRTMLDEQAARFGVSKTAVYEESGIEALVEMATADDVDFVVVAVAGVIGLLPTLAAIRAGKAIGLASKEVLVAAGEIVMPLARAHGVDLVPIDSEHSAIFQCLRGYRPEEVSTAHPHRQRRPLSGPDPRSASQSVTVEEALNHPTWRMGGKITVDSATLMNKGLELIEARWLFGVEVDRIDVVVHPQSVDPLDGRAEGRLRPRPTRLARHEASHPHRPRPPRENPFGTEALEPRGHAEPYL